MFVNFFDQIIVGPCPEQILTNCRAASPALAGELSLVPRESWHADDMYAVRGARFSRFVICDGETRMAIWDTRGRGCADDTAP